MTQIYQQLDNFTYICDENPNGWLRGMKGAQCIDYFNNIFYLYSADFKWVIAGAKSVVGNIAKDKTFRAIKNATVSGGTAIFYLTEDGTSAGNALFSEVFADSIQLIVNDATSSYQFGWSLSADNKTLTVTANKLTTANILTGVLGQGQANGAVVRLTVDGR